MGWSCTRRQPLPRLFQRWSEGPEAPPPPLAASSGPAPRPRAAAGGRCGADLPPKARRREASGTGRGRARRRGARPRQRSGDNGRASAELGRAWGSRGALPTPVWRVAGRGTRAPGPVGGAWCPRVQSPHQAPGRGGSHAGTQTGPWRWACGNPCGTAEEEAPGWRGRGCAAFLYLRSAERHKVSLF